MAVLEEQEGLNVPKCNLSTFFDDLEGKLAFLTDMFNYEEFGLTLEDIRKPMLVIGKPGIGKTLGIIGLINKLNSRLPEGKKLGFKKILLGQTVVGSMSGIPVVMPDGSVQRVQMPDLPDPIRDGEYGVLFLDEITTADEMQIQPALGLADDSRNIGEYSLPEHWIVVAAGNGPDCTNFVRLDDMTISRFSVYDISYDFKKDWRPYAHETGVNPDILAYLSFKNEEISAVESSDMDKAGKQSPNPRTWERLSKEMKMREAMGKPVGVNELPFFAGRIVGKRVGAEFAAFVSFKDKMCYDPKKILEGTEDFAEQPLDDVEAYHILVQQCVKEATTLLKDTVDSNGNHPRAVYEKIGNMVRWFIKYPNLEGTFNSLIEFRDEVPYLSDMMQDSDFSIVCPELDDFWADNMALIADSMEDLNNLKF